MPTILVVDDDADLRHMLLMTIEDAGYRAAGAADGREALGLVREQPPDLIVCDILMPVLDGNSLAAELHGNPRWADIPIIGMSAHREDLHAASAHFAMFLRKPFSVQHLIETIIDLAGPGRDREAARA
ncbi:MAG TPA: response regulator [Herpetosiphonaceae bacterium]